MKPPIVNLQTDLLRAFVSVVDLGSFTKAGRALGRTQPAISLQIRRLEDLLGRPLFRPEGRSFHLTADGERLLSYARDILRINDEAAASFSQSHLSGLLRVGLPSDYAVAFLQGVIIDYVRANPEVSLELCCDVSGRVLEDMHADKLDLAIAMVEPGRTQYLSRSWVERPVWAGAGTATVDVGQGVALAAHPDGCAYRARMIQALDAALIRWRVAYTSTGISGLQDAVLNGLGITALTPYTLLPGMRVMGAAEDLPPLDDIRIGLFCKHPRLSSAGIGLVSHLISYIDAAATSPAPRAGGEARIA